MHKLLFFAWAIIISGTCFSQHFINKSPKKASAILTEIYTEKSIQTSMEQTDSTILFLVRDPKVQDLTIQLHFDRKGKCDKERYLLSCDSCYEKFLRELLNNNRYKWIRVNEHAYASLLPYKLILSTEPGDSFAYSIERSSLSRKNYKRTLNPVHK